MFLGVPAYAGKVLIVRKPSKHFLEVKNAITQELEGHTIIDFILEKNASYAAFKSMILVKRPDLMVLMDNTAVKMGIDLGKEDDPFLRSVPSVATMALNLNKLLKNNKKIAGVAYEVPGFTVITQFRQILTKPIKKVLVMYRKSEFADTIKDLKFRLGREKIELIALNAEAGGKNIESINQYLNDNISTKVGRNKIDAVLVLSDNIMLNKKSFGNIWLQKAKTIGIPFLCGIDRFVSREIDFCTYGASPNHVSLGEQVSELVLAVLEDGESPEDLGVEKIISVVKKLNLDKVMKLNLGLNNMNLYGYSIAM